jgi:hypothetical protein
MAFQWIFDTAESISINRLQNTSITTSRSGIIKTISRGTPSKIITVKLPDGLPWSSYASLIAEAEAADRIDVETITISSTKFPWMTTVTGNYTVRCRDFPQWTIFARNQVNWSGPFVFVQAP